MTRYELYAFICRTVIVALAIFGVIVVEVYALKKGIDGKVMLGSVGVLATIMGYYLRPIKDSIKNKINKIKEPTL